MQITRLSRLLMIAASIGVPPMLATQAIAQAPAAEPQAPAAESSAPPAADQPAFKPEELEQMLAPIALYPDDLLSQILMASTYPVEVVEADRFVKANATLKGDALAAELAKKSWDESVRSLVNFPDVLSMMSENLSTTVKIGDAFIGQQKDVMATVQKLRAKAEETGNLKTTPEQNVSQKVESGTQVIVIESSSPDVVYVPQYSPTVVYGTWPYPAYPPYPYYPPGYVYHPVATFAAGVALGAAWGYAWGNCNWGGGDININSNRNVNRNTNIDRSKVQNRQGSFKHDPSHRQGAAYRNQSSANKVGAGNASNRTSQARNDYRGKADSGRQNMSAGGAGAGNRANTGADRGASASTRQSGATNRSGSTNQAGANNRSGSSGGAFGDANRGGQSARQASDRGNASRSSSPSRSSGGSRGGGASRGGGGRGGGGRR